MGKQQKPNPKNFVTIGRLKEIIAQNNYDKDKIEYLRKAYGTDMSDASPEDIKDQIRLDQIEDQNYRYGKMVKNPGAYKPKVTVKAVVVKKTK
jgi:hypothetical protein